jgi:hypothetical protein
VGLVAAFPHGFKHQQRSPSGPNFRACAGFLGGRKTELHPARSSSRSTRRIPQRRVPAAVISAVPSVGSLPSRRELRQIQSPLRAPSLAAPTDGPVDCGQPAVPSGKCGAMCSGDCATKDKVVVMCKCDGEASAAANGNQPARSCRRSLRIPLRTGGERRGLTQRQHHERGRVHDPH